MSSAPATTVNMFALFELARAREDAISLGLGDPDVPTPAHIMEAANAAIAAGQTGPTEVAGLPELRQAIAAKLARVNGVQADPEREVLVTTGGQEALYLLMQALISDGDEVIVPDPRYTSYDGAVESAGGRLVLAPTSPDDGFQLHAAAVEACITERSKLLLVISPNNPSAGVNTPETMAALAEVAIRHNLLVVADEIYEAYLYDGAQHVSLASLPGMRERTITLNGFSKTYAMTGWRVGYLAGPAWFIEAATALKGIVNVHAPTVSQWAAVAALNGPQTCVEELRAMVDRRRLMMLDAMAELPVRVSRPRGGLYIWADVSPSGMDGTQFSYRLLDEENVLVLPGAIFGEAWGNWIRMTLLQPDDVMQEVLERMRRVFATAPG